MSGASEAAASAARRQRARSSVSGSLSGTASAGSSTAMAGVTDDMRRTRAAAKRAAMDDVQRVTSTAPTQQAKKRAALANLSNHSNIPASRTVAKAQALVQSAKGKSRAVANARDAENVHVGSTIAATRKSTSAFEPNQLRNSSTTVLAVHSNENAPPMRADVHVHVKEEKVAETSVHTTVSQGSQESEGSHVSAGQELAANVNAATIASLERRTNQNLYISRESKTARVRPAGLFSEAAAIEGVGWSSRLNYTDIDIDNTDPQMCSMYATDIYQHLRQSELKRRPATDFMESIQQDINSSMRGILIDWLVEVAEEYKLVPDTLYLTISYIDRFLSSNIVNRQRLQLLGVSCMLIAAKYEEICAPQVEEFCYITDNTYAKEEVLEMERRVLNNLRFELTTPTTKSFLRRFIRAAQAGFKVPTLQLEFLGNFLAELTLVEYSFLQYLPSLVAAAAVFVAKLTLDPSSRPWNATLQHYTGYGPSELRECVQAIHELQANTKKCQLPAIREKYRQHKFKCVAGIAAVGSVPEEYFQDLDC